MKKNVITRDNEWWWGTKSSKMCDDAKTSPKGVWIIWLSILMQCYAVVSTKLHDMTIWRWRNDNSEIRYIVVTDRSRETSMHKSR